MEKWRLEELESAKSSLREVLKKARGDKSRCGASVEACEELELYLLTWVLFPISRAMRKKRDDDVEKWD